MLCETKGNLHQAESDLEKGNGRRTDEMIGDLSHRHIHGRSHWSRLSVLNEMCKQNIGVVCANGLVDISEY